MSWRKHFRVVKTQPTMAAPVDEKAAQSSSAKYTSYLPEVYAGSPSRIQKYFQFQDMDRDSDINASLDTIADFCTQSEEQNDEPFEIFYNSEANETEVTLLKSSLNKWVKLNDFKQRLWSIFRQTIKNGDSFFLRDPETCEWLWIDHFSVEMVKVDNENGKVADEYIIRGVDINRQAKFATKSADPSQYRTPFGTSLVPGSRPQTNPGGAGTGTNVFQMAGTNRDPRTQNGSQVANELSVIDAKHVLHLSLSVGMDINWPFGESILEPIYKTFKQKELLEDSIIIYRVSRAPERRIFYIDVGTMPPIRARAHVEQIKNEIHQRRIPSRTGGGSSIMDAAYSPLSMMDDYYFAQCVSQNTKIQLLDGRTLTLREIIEEYKVGKKNFVYSMNNSTFDLEPGEIIWAGITRKNAEILRINLDNGEYVDATPDHKFILRDGTEIEAQYLKADDSLMPLYLNNEGYTSGTKLAAILDKDATFKEDFKEANSNLKRAKTDREIGTVSWHTVDNTVKVGGYKNWGDFKKNYAYNHKVVSVEVLPYREDTGDITIETASGSHWFALDAGIYVHNSSEGRGSKVETLPGGDNLGEIGDLTFFTKKMQRGLRIPPSYLSMGGENEGGAGTSYNDGKLGAAMIQEFRFNKYCMRLQALLAPVFDKDFKQYLVKNGIEIETSLFELKFNPPQNFSKYRQIDLDTQQVSVYQQVEGNKRLSERFKLKRFLNLTEEELLENERLWSEENAEKIKKSTGSTPAETEPDGDLSSVGIRPGGDDFSDFDDIDGEAPPEGEGEMGGPPPAGGQSPAGGVPPPPPGGAAPPL